MTVGQHFFYSCLGGTYVPPKFGGVCDFWKPYRWSIGLKFQEFVGKIKRYQTLKFWDDHSTERPSKMFKKSKKVAECQLPSEPALGMLAPPPK